MIGWLIGALVTAAVGWIIGQAASGASHVTANLSGTAKAKAERRMFWRGFSVPCALFVLVAVIKLLLWSNTMLRAHAWAPVIAAWAGLAAVAAVIWFAVGWVKTNGVPWRTPTPPADDLAARLQQAGLVLVVCPHGHRMAVPPGPATVCPACLAVTNQAEWVPVRQPEEIGR